MILSKHPHSHSGLFILVSLLQLSFSLKSIPDVTVKFDWLAKKKKKKKKRREKKKQKEREIPGRPARVVARWTKNNSGKAVRRAFNIHGYVAGVNGAEFSKVFATGATCSPNVAFVLYLLTPLFPFFYAFIRHHPEFLCRLWINAMTFEDQCKKKSFV